MGLISCLLLPTFGVEVMGRAAGFSSDAPVIILSDTPGRKVVAYSERAAHKGITLGLTRAQALWYCPEAHCLSEDESLLEQAERDVLRICARFTPRVEAAPDGQAHTFYLDWEDLAPAEGERLSRMLLSQVQTELGFRAQLALTQGKFPAYALAAGSTSGEVRYMAPENIRQALAPLPLELLPLSRSMARRLSLLGFTTIGALAALPSSAVLAQFGKVGRDCHRLALGSDPRPVIPFRAEVITRARMNLEQGVSDRWVLEQLLGQMVTRLVHRLRELGSMGQTLHLSLTLEGQKALKASLTLRRAASGRSPLTQSATRLLNRLEPPAPVVGIELAIADLLPFAGQQLPLWADQPSPREQLRARLETLMTRPGAPLCVYFNPVQPDAPRLERRYRAEHALS